jgi:hypothetical protein
MKVACIMMQRNENLLLTHWIHYHGALFGYENLYIFDNGSDNVEVKEYLGRLGPQYRLNLDYSKTTKADYEVKGDIVVQKIRELEALSDYDFFIPLDCDEFVCVQNGSDISFSREAVLAELGKHRSSPDALKITGCFYNCHGRKDYYYYLDVPKTFFAAGAAGSLDVGYHDGKSRLSPHSKPTAIQLMHLHNKPFKTLKIHAELKLKGRVRSMEPQDLRSYHGPGEHLIRYFFMTEAEYLDSFPKETAIYIPEFAATMDRMGTPLPF